MGIPYSKQINLAFDQVTPLVAAGFKILKTTRNITYLLAAIQVLTALFLFLILVSLIGVIISVNPELEEERKLLVTPAVRWVAKAAVRYWMWCKVALWTVMVGGAVGAVAGWWVTRETVVVEGKGKEGEAEGGEGGEKVEVDV